MARIQITIPTWNEEVVIQKNLLVLQDAVQHLRPNHDVTIEVADNGSTDRTREIVRSVPDIHLLEIPDAGKGRAIRESWERHANDADVFVFLDADLAADVHALPRLIKPILDGHADLVCGSRFANGSRVERSTVREFASLTFRTMQTLILNLPVRDAHCGFKSASRELIKMVLPMCSESHWMFDSELIARTADAGLRIEEIPVNWIEHRDRNRRSAIRLGRDSWSFLTGLIRIKRNIAKIRM